ncbi:flagellar biosynthesis anti-sigma factor FlgM [Sphingomonas sp. UV9]|uniref:flagellar biosynthesis anti-sigma factor FlgM n=1 Tax=Sphingomonas sp. UV9 TaxID=1851410 RepID=UPI000FFBD754|nr:flagellar biosynthesis anti-sigma factor FlgM [Sphingomonas sp. UV9]RXD05014.1 flagellar biosynthesis anti-sigma factor FlgM [Sphingomonas sp. UV9]
MVDSIGTTPSVAGDRTVTRVAAATPTTVVQTPVQPQAQPQASVRSDSLALAKTMAAAPPINATRVAEIKKAIAAGNFPILPATIADRLMALSLAWNSNDKA